MLVDARVHLNDDREGWSVPAEEGCRRLFAKMEEDVAVDRPSVDDVMRRPGSPWLGDTAEVLDKNDNVYADVSGLVLAEEDEPVAEGILEQIPAATACIGDPTRPLLDGSDWSRCTTGPDVDVLVDLEPDPEAREALAWRTTSEVFGIPLDVAG